MPLKLSLIKDLDLLRSFAVETDENLDLLERDIEVLGANRNPVEDDSDLEDRFARSLQTIHTIKGAAVMLSLKELADSAHSLEDLLFQIRNGHRGWDTALVRQICEIARSLRQMAWRFVQEDLESRLDCDDPTPAPVEVPKRSVARSSHTLRYGTERRSKPAAMAANHPSKPLTVRQAKMAANLPSSTMATSNAVDVDAQLFGKLNQLVEQIPLVQQQLEKCSRPTEDGKLNLAFRWLNLIGSEMRETLIKLRQEPIDNHWNCLPRLLCELAATRGKQAQLKMDGADLRLDQHIIRAIQDSLTHILRNAVDHGIETPEVRESNGKPPVATVSLTASRILNHIQIEVKDDGQGVDVERVKQQALRMKLLTAAQAARMTEPEITQFILRPGLSTAEQLTNSSGRGIGLDVVRAKVEGLGGSLEIRSMHGQGTTIQIRIPLSKSTVA